MIETILMSVAFLLIGAVTGFLAQRSRMCFVGGFRDWLLVRDSELLLGLFSFLATVWLATSVLYAVGLLRQGMPEYGVAAGNADRILSFRPRLGALLHPKVLGSTEAAVGIATLANRFMGASFLGGWMIGLLSVAAGGCVLRQHVLCAQGSRNALFFLIGFYVAVPVFYSLLQNVVSWVYQ